MSRLSRTLVVAVALAIGAGLARAASIVPPADLGELARASRVVVQARCTGGTVAARGELLFTLTGFVVERSVRGPYRAGDAVTVETPGGELNGRGWLVPGAPAFVAGGSYLLLLSSSPEGLLRPVMLSYGLLREVAGRNGTALLAPLPEMREMMPFPRQDGVLPEPIGTYRSDALLAHLARVVRGEERWNADTVLAGREELPLLASAATAPSGCVFMGGGPYIRWPDFDSGGQVAMHASTTPDPSLPGGGYAEIEGALDDWMAVPATGLNLRYGGTLAYTMQCTWRDDTPASGVNIVMLNDPCSDIDNLRFCSGVLAYGGPWYGATHTFDGQTWYSAVSWFVVVNNGVGCLGSHNVQLMMAHELGHGLGFGHVADPNALMYAYCCNEINATDTSCAQYLYPPSVTDPPAAPTGLAATAASSSRIDLTWSDNADNESGFTVERRSGGGAFQPVASLAADVTAYQDGGLAAETGYSYRVRAFNGAGSSAYSNEASATTQAPPPPPSAPTGLSAVALSSSAIALSWADTADNESGFTVERRSGGGAFQAVASVGADVTGYQDGGLAAETTYTYRVKAVNESGDSPYSNQASATTESAPGPPAAPSNLVGSSPTGASIVLAWQDNAGNEDGFYVERSSGWWFLRIATVAADAAGYVDTGVRQNRTYRYRVRAFNGYGTSASSNTVSVTATPSGSPPAAPTGLAAAAASSEAIALSWSDNADDETGFAVERRSGGGAFQQVATVGANVTGYQDGGLAPETTYTYRVRATNGAGASAYSNEASATTQAAAPSPPAAPSALSAAAVSSDTIALSWSDNAGNEDAFAIERRSGGGAFQQVATVGADVTGYQDGGLAPETTYTYRVRATNAAGSSAYSNEASATTRSAGGGGTAPAAPSNLAASVKFRKVTLTWTDNAGDEDGFIVERRFGLWGGWMEAARTGADVTTYVDSIPRSGTYSYRVRAFNAAGTSDPSNEQRVRLR